jgi:hypothetical protein
MAVWRPSGLGHPGSVDQQALSEAEAWFREVMESQRCLATHRRLSGWFPDLVGPIRGCGFIGLVLIREGDAQRLVELARERGYYY